VVTVLSVGLSLAFGMTLVAGSLIEVIENG
jgi:hypothetical protein